MIDRHYIRTICRYVDDLARKNELMVHTGATPALLREIGVLSITIKNLADAAIESGTENIPPRREQANVQESRHPPGKQPLERGPISSQDRREAA